MTDETTQLAQQSTSIWPPHEAFYIDSMLFNSSSAVESIAAVAGTREAVAGGALEHTALDEDALLDHLQNIVVQGAALSRYLWPVRKGHESRGEQLRTALGVTEASPLRSRDLRNAIEHFDERLDRYLAGNVVGHILPRYVGPTPRTDGVPLHLFRAYFVDGGVFSLLGEQHEIQPLADEIGRLHELLVQLAETGSRLPRINS